MKKRKVRRTTILPLLPRRDTVLFPHMISQLLVRRPSSVRAVEEAWGSQNPIAIFARKESTADEITIDTLYSIGCEGIIARVLRLPDGTTTAWVQGQRRLSLERVIEGESYPLAKVRPIAESTEKPLLTEALMRAVLALFEKCAKLSPRLSEEAYIAALNIDEPGWLADFIASTLEFSLAQRQVILETFDPHKRLEQVSILLAKELEVLQIQSNIDSKVREEVDKGQREFFLREQMKAIQKELGDTDPFTRETNELKAKISKVGMPEVALKKAQDEVERLTTMPQASPEVSVVRTYLDWLINLPWTKATEDNLDIKQASSVLEKNHYGLPKVKERLLEYMAVRQLAGSKLRSPILCFVGPPGVGKTSLGRSIAQALGRKFVRLSLGGIRDEAEIRGHRRTYVGAMPGRIIQTMRTAATINPVFMLDEIDKVGADFRGDPSAALLEVLDLEQNHSFSDHYLDVPYNLSQVLFIATANIVEPIIPALKDRMETIELPGYIEEEKLHIAKLFLVPKQLEEHGLTSGQLRFSDGALRGIIREYTREAGVRNLEREIGSICRKRARRVTEGDASSQVVTAQSLAKYLGPTKFFWGVAEEKDQVGVATGVVWTQMGGDIISVEVTLMPGKGNLLLTGQLGDVMKESAQAALSFVRSRASGLFEYPYDKTDIHIHVPAGAVPKDGPSAGVTMATALISALSRRPVRRDVAMTGEITLRGRVLPVGGIKEKVLAAHRAGIKTFIMPEKNENDLSEVPGAVRRELEFVFVDDVEEVLSKALAASGIEHRPLELGVV